MASKDKENNTWIAQWYETDAYGKRRRRKKRGFKTLREAKQFEHEKTSRAVGSMSMLLSEFVEVYFEDKENELKPRTKNNKRYMMNQHILPYFGKMRMDEITPTQIVKWKNEMYKKEFSESYLRMLNNQLVCLFTHASRMYDLENNPCKKVPRMGKSDTRSMTFWTVDEYETYIATYEPGTRDYIMCEVLFWTGMREGEMLALTMKDIDFENNQISISKTYYRSKGTDIITAPKTEQSIRVIDIPNFLKEEIKQWCDMQYALLDDIRLFPIVAEAVQHKMERHIELAGVKKIRVHDLRHSHVAYPINQGIEPLIIKERLGHKDIKITLNTYGHLYPNQQKQVAELLDRNRTKKES